jgi:hypothetical protein
MEERPNMFHQQQILPCIVQTYVQRSCYGLSIDSNIRSGVQYDQLADANTRAYLGAYHDDFVRLSIGDKKKTTVVYEVYSFLLAGMLATLL